MRILCATLLVLGFALPAHADDERGRTFCGQSSGRSDSSGFVMPPDPSIGLGEGEYEEIHYIRFRI